MLAAGAAVSATEPLCLNNRVCIYGDNDFGDFLGSRGPGFGIRTVSDKANDKMDSWKNRTRQIER